MEKNQIKICCDPYNKKIQYYWCEENGQWVDLTESEDSPLNSRKFVNASLSQISFSLLEIFVKNYYNKTVGLEIVFEGTLDDYEDLLKVKKSHFDKYDIEINKGTRKMNVAEDVMPQIEGIFKEVEEYFAEYPDEDTEKKIYKYRETVRPEIALCIMGLYSSGKSAFVNSLIGTELLPSDSDPATAKIYRIEESEKKKITFGFQGEQYTIEFCGNKWKSNKSLDSDILTKIKNTLEEQDCKNEDELMYWTIYSLNDYAKMEGQKMHNELVECAREYMNSKSLKPDSNDKDGIKCLLNNIRIKELIAKGKVSQNLLDNVIRVSTAFTCSSMPIDKFKFIIYDTPGSDSVQFREHVEVLKESLEQQTNGLPIFVTDPAAMDKDGNNDLMCIIDELGGALDLANIMLVVNKSDTESPTSLKRKAENKENLVLTKEVHTQWLEVLWLQILVKLHVVRIREMLKL